MAHIGRQSDLLKLQNHFDPVHLGQLRVAFIVGEPGIGKTALLETFAGRAAEQGAIILRGNAAETEGMPPYLPFLEALGAHIRSAPSEHLHHQVSFNAATLAGLFPELAHRLGDMNAPPTMPPEQARLRLYEAVGQFIAAIAADQPLVILLDDLHWAEAATFDLLTHIARTQRAARVLWLLACRPEEAARHPALERARAELNRLRLSVTLNLGPLAADEIAQLATHYLGGPTHLQLHQRLYTFCEGNPFFAEELLRDWRESGRVVQEHGLWTLTEARRESLPEGIASLIGQRLARQPAEVVETLRAAALIGRAFEAALVAEVTGQPLETIEAHLERAVEAWLVQAEAGGQFSFRHTPVRETLYAQIPFSRRQRWHGVVAQALGKQPTPPPTALALHYARSGEREKGAHCSLLAGQLAMQAYAWEEAIANYQAALDLLTPSDPRRGETLLGLGEAQRLAGREHDAVTAFSAARAWHKQAGDSALAARAAHRLGQVYWRLEDLANARSSFETALVLLKDDVSPDRVQAMVDLGSLLAVSLHQQTEGLALGQEALHLAQQLEDGRLIASASRTVGNLLVRGNRLREGIPLLEQALRLAAAADDPAEAVECCANLTLAYAWSTDFQRAFDTLERWEIFATQSHDPYQRRHIYSMRAVGNTAAGEWAQAESDLNAAQAIVERLASPEPLAILRLNRGLLAYYRDDFVRAEAEFESATEMFRGMGPGALVWYLGALGMALAAQGKRADAHRVMDEVERLIGALPPGLMPTSESLSHLTQAALWLKDEARLARYYPLLTAFRGQYHDALVDRLLGLIETRQGNWAQARASLGAAETVARRYAQTLELAHTLQAQADLELAQGRRGDAAREKLTEAASVFQTLGLTEREHQAREQLRQLSSGGAQTFPAGLSAREVEVLQLVAQGQSNRQIAHTLHLSEKTVGNHLTSILNKIGVDNRAAATAFALRNRLVE